MKKNISLQKLQFSEEFDISDGCNSFFVFNNNMWAISRDKSLFYANLNESSHVICTKIDKAVDVNSIHVSPNGYHCIFSTKNQLFYVNKDDFQLLPINLIPGTHMTSVFWKKNNKTGEMIAYMTTNGTTLLFLDLNKKMKTVQVIPLPMIQKLKTLEPIGLKIVDIQNKKIGVLLITKTRIIPYFLDKNFICDKTQTKKTMIVPTIKTNINPVSSESDCIGVMINDTSILAFDLNYNAKNVHDMLQKQMLYTVPDNTVWYKIQDDLMYVISDKLIIYYINNGNMIELLSYQIEKCNSAAFDPYTCNFYTLSNEGVNVISLPLKNKTRHHFLSYILESSYPLNDIDISTKLFMNSGVKLSSFLNKYNNQERIKILTTIIYNKKIMPFIKRRRAIAALLLEELTRSNYQTNNNDECINIIEGLYNENLVSKEQILMITKTYNAQRIYLHFADVENQIAFLFSNGRIKESSEKLFSIDKSDEKNKIFTKYAVILSKFMEKEVVDAILKRGKISDTSLIPLLVNDAYSDGVINIYKTGKMKYYWEYELFMRFAIKNSFFDFFYDKSFPEDIKWEAVRELYKEKRYKDVSFALTSMHNYTDAALVATRTSLEDSIDVINKIHNREDRIKCVLRVLTSLSKEDAGKFSTLLSKMGCVETSIALKYMPDNIRISELYDTINNFVLMECKDARSLDKQIFNSKLSNRKAMKINKLPFNMRVDISTAEKCCICNKPIASDKMKIFRCRHVVHEKCSPNECPFCGIQQILNIDKPYDNISNNWEVPNDL